MEWRYTPTDRNKTAEEFLKGNQSHLFFVEEPKYSPGLRMAVTTLLFFVGGGIWYAIICAFRLILQWLGVKF